MKTLRLLTLMLLWGMLVTGNVIAAEGPTINPTQLTIAGTQGRVETRTFYLRATVPITSMRAVSLDLLHTDNARVLPAGAVHVHLPAATLAAGELLTATLTVNLQKVPAGTYSGQVLFVGADATPVPLNLTVHVRHPWVGPAAITVLGVVLGLLIPWYQAHGRARDALFIRLGRLTQALANDSAFAEHFGAQVKPLLQQAHAALAQGETALAEAAIKAAEALFKQWLAGREDWIAQLRYLREDVLRQLENHAEAYGDMKPLAVCELLTQAHTLLTQPAGPPDHMWAPQELQEKIEALVRAWERYRALAAQLEEIDKLRADLSLSADEDARFRQQSLQLQRQLRRLSLENTGAWEELETQVKTLSQGLLEKLEGVQEETREYMKGPRSSRRGDDTRLRELLAMPPLTPAAPPLVAAYGVPGAETASGWFRGIWRRLGWERHPIDTQTQARRQTRWAAVRHTFFTLLLYFLTGLFLAGLGFSNLYLDNPSFGAQPVLNYLTLLAWGLGAETSVTSIGGLLKKWELPASVPGGSG